MQYTQDMNQLEFREKPKGCKENQINGKKRMKEEIEITGVTRFTVENKQIKKQDKDLHDAGLQIHKLFT